MVKSAAGKDHQSVSPSLLNIDWRWPAAAAIAILILIVLWTQDLVNSTDDNISPQIVEVEDKPSSGLDSISPTEQTAAQSIQPGIAVVEDNIFIGDLSAAAKPNLKITDRIQSPSYRLTIPNQRESTKFLFQGAYTLIPAKPF